MQPRLHQQISNISIDRSAFQRPYASLFVALGIETEDPGYDDVASSIGALGRVTALHAGLWRLNTTSSSHEVFRQINESLLDPRIDGDSGLLVLNTNDAKARWYLRQPASEMLSHVWNQRNDLFFSVKMDVSSGRFKQFLDGLHGMGTVIPIGKNIYYVSSGRPLKAAFAGAIGHLRAGEGLIVFDASGNQAMWQERPVAT